MSCTRCDIPRDYHPGAWGTETDHAYTEEPESAVARAVRTALWRWFFAMEAGTAVIIIYANN